MKEVEIKNFIAYSNIIFLAIMGFLIAKNRLDLGSVLMATSLFYTLSIQFILNKKSVKKTDKEKTL
ncbi:hypothetical protein [Clostridium tertium]|uniref:Uncharacterized protein n=1 Tax=Clostridium tertium TaxID=1559 RepID=A0A6N3G2Z8_9CLOT